MNSQRPISASGFSITSPPISIPSRVDEKSAVLDLTQRFQNSAEIIRRIEKACANRPIDDATIAISFPGGTNCFSLDKNHIVREISSEEPLRLPAACMTKLHTATVAIEKFSELGISIDASAQELLQDLFDLRLPALRGVTIRHLLNSSHGLDDPRFEPYAVKGGYVDFEQLYSRFTSVPALTDSGSIFSFSDVGMLFVGAILERVTRRPFGNLVKEDLLPKLTANRAQRLGATASSYRVAEEDNYVCPTAGADFTISASDLLDLASLYFVNGKNATNDSTRLLNSMRDHAVGFAGWTGMGNKVGLGWHCYPGEWWGYNGATVDGGSLLMRMQPEAGVALAIISKKLPAHYLAMSAFSEVLPEAKMIRPPKLLSAAELAATDLTDWEGRYEIGSLALDIRSVRTNDLSLTIKHRFEDYGPLEAPISCGVRIAENRTFYTVPAELRFLSLGQIVDLPMGGRQQRYVWNGRRLWRKATD